MNQTQRNLAGGGAALMLAMESTLDLFCEQVCALALLGGLSKLPEDAGADLPIPPQGSGLLALFGGAQILKESMGKFLDAGESRSCRLALVFESPETFVLAGSGTITQTNPSEATAEMRRLLEQAIAHLPHYSPIVTN